MSQGGYTPMSPPAKRKESSQQPPEDEDEKDILTSVCPEGLSDECVKTFIFKKQGHTLGNILRDQLLRYREVQFAGYSIPHPGEHVMHLRIQTHQGSGVTADAVLKKALRDVIAMCEHVEGLFLIEMQRNGMAVS